MYLATAHLRPVRFVFFTFCLFTGFSSGARAQTQLGARIAFHAEPWTSKSPCALGADLASQTDCATYTTSGLPLSTPLNLYVVVAGTPGPGLTAADLGIAYDGAPASGVDVYGWTLCAALEFPRSGAGGAWPSSGSANRILWGECQQTVPPGGSYVQALAGFFYVYAYDDDVLEATPERTGTCYGELVVADCSGNETDLMPGIGNLGMAGFGSGPGFNPCNSYVDASFCGIFPDVLDFGTVLMGESADLTLRIADVGGFGPGIEGFSVGPFDGGDFTIVSGAGTYEDPLRTLDVTFRFSPSVPGHQEILFEVDPCTYCPPLTLRGNGIEAALPVSVDIRPGACPNPVSLKGKGALRVAVLGSADFDVTRIDPATVKLAGVPAGPNRVQDVGAPSAGGECACSHGGLDGHEDLSLKFSTQEVVETLEPASFQEEWVLPLTGNLLDGTPIEGTDCVVLVGLPGIPDGGSPGSGGGAQVSPLSLDVRREGNGHRIGYRLAEPGEVTLDVFDVRGRLVERIVRSYAAGGEHTALWSGVAHPRGVYFFRLRQGARALTRKATLLPR